MKVNQSKISRIIIFLIVNITLLLMLYNIPINNNKILENLCIYKNLFKIECLNCGMTRAFLSILHVEYEMAINYNSRCIFIFPVIVLEYLYSWYKFIMRKNNNNFSNS